MTTFRTAYHKSKVHLIDPARRPIPTDNPSVFLAYSYCGWLLDQIGTETVAASQATGSIYCRNCQRAARAAN